MAICSRATRVSPGQIFSVNAPIILLLLAAFQVPAPPPHGPAKTTDAKLLSGVRAGDARSVLASLHGGASPNGRAHCGTPLYLAAAKGEISIVGLLVSRGADPNIPVSRIGTSALSAACIHGDLRTVRYLISHGAVVNARDRDGISALALSSNVGVAKALLAAGADPNAVDDRCDSILHSYAAYGSASLIRLALSRGISVNARDSAGKTAVIVACEQAKRDCDNGDRARAQLDRDVVRTLLEHGANPTERDIAGESATSVAEKDGLKKLAALLRSHKLRLGRGPRRR